jgi:hypothetical protein
MLATVAGVGVGLGMAEVALRVWERIQGSPIVPGVVEGYKTLRHNGHIKPNLDVVIHRHPTSGRDVRVRCS